LPLVIAPGYEGRVVCVKRVAASSLLVVACGGGSAPTGANAPRPVVASEPRHAAPNLSGAAATAGGSSDGTTCEQARDLYTEEINLQGGTAPDLKAEDFAAVLNNGSYMNPCDVPSTSKVRICAAVQNGRAVGVTVLLDPPSTDIEICVAGQVRKLPFPPNAKMDVVNVSF
jgi:eukaryotic-like serine/threonine-protein kinase